MQRKRRVRSPKNMSRREKTRREIEARVIKEAALGDWVLKNFLLPEEKRHLISFYRDAIADALMGQASIENEDAIKQLSTRLKFIVDHF